MHEGGVDGLDTLEKEEDVEAVAKDASTCARCRSLSARDALPLASASASVRGNEQPDDAE